MQMRQQHQSNVTWATTTNFISPEWMEFLYDDDCWLPSLSPRAQLADLVKSQNLDKRWISVLPGAGYESNAATNGYNTNMHKIQKR